jgi:flagellin
MAVRNANDAISMVSTADGAYVEITNMLQRMRELAIQSASGTMGSNDRTALNTEYQALSSQIQQIGANTQWNGSNLLDDTVGTNGSVAYQVGANASQTVSVDMGDVAVSDITVSVGSTSTGTDPLATLTFSADLAEGDVISFKIDDTNYGQITLTSAEATAINDNTASTPALDTVNDQDSAVIIQASTADTSGGNQISLATATADAVRTLRIVGENASSYTFSLSDVKVSRGIHGELME